MIATQDSFEPHSLDQLPASSRVYVQGQIHPDVQVPMREIKLSPTKAFNGRIVENDPVRVYDCSGPWGDPPTKAPSKPASPVCVKPGSSPATTSKPTTAAPSSPATTATSPPTTPNTPPPSAKASSAP
jgi:hypothetical protein